MVARLDSSGNIKWMKVYPVRDLIFSEIEPVGNSGFILGCYSGGIGKWGIHPNVAVIMRLDLRGEIVWQRSYFSTESSTKVGPTSRSPYFDFCLTDDGIIVTRYVANTEYGGSSIFKIDLSGGIIWSKSFHSVVHGGVTDLMALTQLSNGNIAIVGRTTEFTEYTHHGLSDFNTIATVFDENGNFLWIKVFGRNIEDSESHDGAFAVTEGDDGEIVYAGITKFFNNSEDFFVVKMDANWRCEQGR